MRAEGGLANKYTNGPVPAVSLRPSTTPNGMPRPQIQRWVPRPRRARATTIALGSTTAGTVRLYDAAHHNVVTRSVFWPTAIWSANWNPTCTKFGASAARARIRVTADAGLIAVHAYLNNVAFVFLKKKKPQAVPRLRCIRIACPRRGMRFGRILGPPFSPAANRLIFSKT